MGRNGLFLGLFLDLVVVLLLVIAGRITPAFTQNALRQQGLALLVRSRPWLSALAIGAATALALSTLLTGRTRGCPRNG